ncbi:hypothetical protein KIN_18670 [Litoreibacter roseus]|uniref:Uncharacterized protein n=1 Tax=Litoreibacter roseus TaxID=2601869 RepID=A0A6N6JEL6_9RHOB|nr:hypothetical protein KIN_18670 [Litoreibacter roseus]
MGQGVCKRAGRLSSQRDLEPGVGGDFRRPLPDAKRLQRFRNARLERPVDSVFRGKDDAIPLTFLQICVAQDDLEQR